MSEVVQCAACAACTAHHQHESQERERPQRPYEASELARATAPPPVCTGSGWPAVYDLANTSGTGICGICGQRLTINVVGRVATHPWLKERP